MNTSADASASLQEILDLSHPPVAIGFLVSQGYLEMCEVPGISVLANAPEYVANGAGYTGAFAADVILIATKPAAAMMLYEIALRADAASPLTNNSAMERHYREKKTQFPILN